MNEPSDPWMQVEYAWTAVQNTARGHLTGPDTCVMSAVKDYRETVYAARAASESAFRDQIARLTQERDDARHQVNAEYERGVQVGIEIQAAKLAAACQQIHALTAQLKGKDSQ